MGVKEIHFSKSKSTVCVVVRAPDDFYFPSNPHAHTHQSVSDNLVTTVVGLTLGHSSLSDRQADPKAGRQTDWWINSRQTDRSSSLSLTALILAPHQDQAHQ